MRIAGISRDRCGSVALEFALFILPLLALVLGVVEYGRLQFTRSALNEVAIAGARCAGLAAASCSTASGEGRAFSASQTTAYIRAEASARYVVLGTPDISIDGNTTCDGANNLVRVQLNYSFSSPFLAPIRSLTLPVTAVACFPNQG